MCSCRKKFFEAGIERIVDQVVNPKLNANFVPKIEDVAYKLLGVERPSPNMKTKLKIETDVMLPGNYELEQVSPDSENDLKHPSNSNIKVKNYNIYEYVDTKTDDLESPEFEPVGQPDTNINSKNDDDMDISDGDDMPHQMNEVKSNISSISGLTSNESNNSSSGNVNVKSSKTSLEENHLPTETMEDKAKNRRICLGHQKPYDTSSSSDLAIDHDSVLSQVSSETNNSRLSIVTNNISISPEDAKYNCTQIDTIDECRNDHCLYGISEETQMQKFNESSSSGDGSAKHLYKDRTGECGKDQTPQFDLKTEEIIFEGTTRAKFENEDIAGFKDVEKGFRKNENTKSGNSKFPSKYLTDKKKEPCKNYSKDVEIDNSADRADEKKCVDCSLIPKSCLRSKGPSDFEELKEENMQKSRSIPMPVCDRYLISIISK